MYLPEIHIYKSGKVFRKKLNRPEKHLRLIAVVFLCKMFFSQTGLFAYSTSALYTIPNLFDELTIVCDRENASSVTPQIKTRSNFMIFIRVFKSTLLS